MKKNAGRLEDIRNKRRNLGDKTPADWSSANPALVLSCIAWTAANGGALRFGYTRDGGAYAVGIYLENDSTTEYIRPSEDIDEYLTGLALDMEDMYRASKQK